MQVYADNAATTRMSDKALAAMTPYFHQGAPHILIQPQQGQQRLDLKFRFSFRHLRRLLLYGRVYLLLDAVLNERCGQPGQRTRKGGGDHARANQCHDRDHQSRQRLRSRRRSKGARFRKGA